MSEYNLRLELPQIENAYSHTQTEINLWKAFIGESIARNRYSFYASQAKKAGYEQMAEILLRISDNEKEHAKLWFKRLGQLQSLDQNLRMSAQGERHEWSEMYVHMAEDAKRDGYPQLATLFESVAAIEQHHEELFSHLIWALDHETIFSRKDIVLWECRNCGHIEVGTSAPDICPVCQHPQAYFQVNLTSSEIC